MLLAETNYEVAHHATLLMKAWSITPGTPQHLFDETNGTHPVFNLPAANNPNMDVSTAEARLDHD